MEWRHAVHTPFPQKNPSEKISWKRSASIFWDQDGIILIDYL